MIRQEFVEAMLSGKGAAVIMAGSDSDIKHIDALREALGKYGIPHDVRICSAHKQLEGLAELFHEYNTVGGSVAYIGVAGGTDALSGALSYNALGPVISCPPDTNVGEGRHNESCLNNPPGSSNAYIARVGNVARFVAQMYAGVNLTIRGKLIDERLGKVTALINADDEIQEAYGRKTE